jgi:hypothetical protein
MNVSVLTFCFFASESKIYGKHSMFFYSGHTVTNPLLTVLNNAVINAGDNLPVNLVYTLPPTHNTNNLIRTST